MVSCSFAQPNLLANGELGLFSSIRVSCPVCSMTFCAGLHSFRGFLYEPSHNVKWKQLDTNIRHIGDFDLPTQVKPGSQYVARTGDVTNFYCCDAIFGHIFGRIAACRGEMKSFLF